MSKHQRTNVSSSEVENLQDNEGSFPKKRKQTTNTSAATKEASNLDPSLLGDVFSHPFMDPGLGSLSSRDTTRYLDRLAPSDYARSMNINIISKQKKHCFMTMPPHYKCIDTTSNTNYNDTNTLPFPDAMNGLPFVFRTNFVETGLQGIGQTCLNNPALGTGSNERVGRRIDLKRLQVRLMPSRSGPIEDRNISAGGSFNPEYIRIIIYYDRSARNAGDDDFSPVLVRMALNSTPQGIPPSAVPLSPGDSVEDYFRTNNQYVYGPLNPDSAMRLIPLVDKILIMPTMTNQYRGHPEDGGVYTDYKLESTKYDTSSLKCYEFDIDLEGLSTQFRSDDLEDDIRIDPVLFGEHQCPKQFNIASGALVMSLVSQNFRDGNTWDFRGFTRVFYTDD